MAKIENSMAYILRNEGGFTNDPVDPGGATNLGITIGDLKDWRKHPVTVDDVKNLTLIEATQIYKARYWDRMSLDAVNDQAIATVIFDVGVNRGVNIGLQYATAACAQLKKSNINDCNPHEFIAAYEPMVEQGYRDIITRKPKLVKFINGWMARAKRLLTLG